MNKKLLVFNTITCLLLWSFLLSGWTDTIDTSLPAGTDDPAEADDNMRRIQGGFQEILAVEHNVDLTGTAITGDGKHTAITGTSITVTGAVSSATVAASGNGTVGGTLGVTGVATVAKGSLLASSDAPTADAMIANKKYVDDQITAGADPTYAGAESHTFNGGLIIKMGITSSIAANGSETVTFGTAFPTALISITTTPVTSSTGVFTSQVSTVSKTAVTIRNSNDSTAVTIYWTAIGH